MSGYSERTFTATCPNGHENGVVVAYAGDGRGNEREAVECFKCGTPLHTEKCFAIYSGPTIDDAVADLRKMQGR